MVQKPHPCPYPDLLAERDLARVRFRALVLRRSEPIVDKIRSVRREEVQGPAVEG